jgi:hypothetical protein
LPLPPPLLLLMTSAGTARAGAVSGASPAGLSRQARLLLLAPGAGR